MKSFSRKFIATTALLAFTFALITPVQAARRSTTSEPPPTVGTDEKPVVSPA